MHPDLTDRQRLARHALTIMRLGLCFYVLLFPWGQALREIGGAVATCGLVLTYLLDWRGTNLSRFPLRWLVAAFWAFVIFKIFHSMHPPSGLYALAHNITKGPMLLLAAMEAVRSRRDLYRLAWLGMAMAVTHGLAESWEYFSQGWISNKRFGNLFSLVLPLFFCLPVLLPKRWGRPLRWSVTGLAALPAVIAWGAAQARSGWFGLVAAAFGYVWMRWGIVRALVLAVVILGALFAYRPGLITPEHIMADARWKIWNVAVKEFKANPILGVGANAFEPAYKAMGHQFDPEVFDLPVPHPHNIYLQFLAEGGVVGLAMLLAFLLGVLAWSERRIRIPLARPRPDARWIVAASFWSAYLGYLVTGLSAHNFYRTWWLGMAMTMLGVTLGACLTADRPPPRHDPVPDA